MFMNLSSMKYIKVRKHQNSDFERCQDFEDTGKIRCLCQNGSRHKNENKSLQSYDLVLNDYIYRIVFQRSLF